jgi:hypothetical protein
MSLWFERWYGDGCPGWTWPITTLAVILLFVVVVFLV